MKLENMTLPSGRKLIFDCDYRDITCRLVSSLGGYIGEGKGWSRIDALWMVYFTLADQYCIGFAPFTAEQIAALENRHDRYRAYILNELWELHNDAKTGIPKPSKSDVWGVVR